MRQNLTVIILFLCLCILPVGCGKENEVYLEQAASQMQGAENGSSEASGAHAENADASGTEAESKGADASSTKKQGTAVENKPAEISGTEMESGMPTSCYVYVCGAVKHPGVYVLSSGSRIYEAVALAGGMTDEASAESVNQALTVSDGQMIRILTQEEAGSGGASAGNDTGGDTAVSGSIHAEPDDGKININQASAAELMDLPGIGQKKAESIVSYRESNGAFSDIAQLMNVEGIKEGVYNRVKEYIKVK